MAAALTPTMQRATHAAGPASDRLAPGAACGAALTLVVVATSVYLRLHTTMDAGGNAASLLDPATEMRLRLLHRLCASAVGIVALVSAVIVARSRPMVAPRVAAIAAVIVLTLALAAIGRLTPGYRLPSVTIANVVCGIGLACAFAWLYFTAAASPLRLRPQPLAVAGIVAVLLHAASGAAASAARLSGSPTLDAWHVPWGPVVLGIVVAALAARRGARPSLTLTVAAPLATAAQFASGLWLAAWGETAAPLVAWGHAMLAAGLALVLVRLAARSVD